MLDWLTIRMDAISSEQEGHRAWVEKLSGLLVKHTTALEASLILTALNLKDTLTLARQSLWLDLYRAFTHVLLQAQVHTTAIATVQYMSFLSCNYSNGDPPGGLNMEDSNRQQNHMYSSQTVASNSED
jgi:hypothetical protein